MKEGPKEPLGIVTEILEILLIAYNVLIINANYEDKKAKETNLEQQNQETQH